MNPGDIALVWFPFTRDASEPFKKRPVLILSDVGLMDDQAITCVMITSNEQRFKSRGAGDVRVSDFRGCGLPKPSTIRTRRLWTAQSSDLASQVKGHVPPAMLEEVRELIRDTLRL